MRALEAPAVGGRGTQLLRDQLGAKQAGHRLQLRQVDVGPARRGRAVAEDGEAAEVTESLAQGRPES